MWSSVNVIKDDLNEWVVEFDTKGYSVESVNSNSSIVWIPGADLVGDNTEELVPVAVFDLAVPYSSSGAWLVTPKVEYLEDELLVNKDLVSAEMADAVGDISNLELINFNDFNISKGLSNINVSNAILRDGLYIRKIVIPLASTIPAGINIHTKIRVSVTYPNLSGYFKNKANDRALKRVDNVKAAANMAVSNKSSLLSKTASKELDAINWYFRMEIGDKEIASLDENCVYALAYSDLYDLLAGQGLSRSSYSGIPIEKIRIYTGFQDTLTSLMTDSIPTPGNLQQVPIRIVDRDGSSSTGDGIFGVGDSIYFYGVGSSYWKRFDLIAPEEAVTNLKYNFTTNSYSFYQYYYFGASSYGNQKQQEKIDVNYNSSYEQDKVINYRRAEKDLALRDIYFGYEHLDNETGAEWFWLWGDLLENQSFSNANLQHENTVDLPGYIAGENAYVGVTFFPHRSNKSYKEYSNESLTVRFSELDFSMTVNGTTLTDSTRSLHTFVFETDKLKEQSNTFSLDLIGNKFHANRFDGYTIAYKSEIEYSSGGSLVLPDTFDLAVNYQIKGSTADLKVLKIKDGIEVGELAVVNSSFVDSVGLNDNVYYYLYTTSDVKKITSVQATKTHSLTCDLTTGNSSEVLGSSVEYLIITSDELIEPSIELSNYRNSGDYNERIPTVVASLGDIYREYSSGRISPHAIRDFIRHAYHNWGGSLKYVLLIGDGSYDYRNLLTNNVISTFMPPYELEALASEDYYAMLDSGEVLSYGEYDLDVAIGRLPFKNSEEFNDYLVKISDYEKTGVLDNSEWRNTVVLAADDNWQRTTPDYINHTGSQEFVSAMLDSFALENNFDITKQKVYLVDYEVNSSYAKPEAKTALIEQINRGALFVTYFGHGSGTVWADELLLDLNSLSQLDNKKMYPILGSFACTVGRFEQTSQGSISEAFLIEPNKGAIASIGGTRETYSTPNRLIAYSVLQNSFFDESTPTLGESFNKAKITTSKTNRYTFEKYVLLGEPVLKFNNSNLEITFDQDIDTLQALQKVILSGSVKGADAGEIFIQVFQEDEIRNFTEELPNRTYSQNIVESGKKLHSEKVVFKDSKFETEFIMPRKINFGDTNAKISAYAWVDGTDKVGHGLVTGISIDGTSSYADSIDDNIAPEIYFRPCGVSDSSGGNFGRDQVIKLEIPACLEVLVTDSTGLDLQDEADEGIVFELVNEKDPWHPYPFIEQTGKRVVARMLFTDSYTSGEYLFKVQAQDILGNYTYRQEKIELIDEIDIGIMDVYNAPNPMKDYTYFYFKDFASNHRSEITIKIFNQSGRLIKVIHNAKSGETKWDGRDRFGKKLANGLYYYKVFNTVEVTDLVNSSTKTKTFSELQKLLISR